jgi:2-polyprenyl-6-methoxyphenol hydroxylase-like FAD-dependent oxidoreductase
VNIDHNGDQLPSNKVGLNIDPTGTRSFDVVVRTMENVAIEYKSHGKRSVIVAALGDALANTHFFTGTGMSIGMYLKLSKCLCTVLF